MAFPCKLGQSLTYLKHNEKLLEWNSIDADNKTWFKTVFTITKKTIEAHSSDEITNTLLRLLQIAKEKNPTFLNYGGKVTTHLEFPKEFGLGSSSTLIANIALWANINPYELLWEGFSGSGYDIACANSFNPLLYQLTNNTPKTTLVQINYDFSDQLFFVYLNKKQNSREGIAQYRKKGTINSSIIDEISEISEAIAMATSLASFELLLNKHEDIISALLDIHTIKTTYFSDYNGCIKSLGAWGGDFVLATGAPEYVKKYFSEKGFKIIIPFEEMVL